MGVQVVSRHTQPLVLGSDIQFGSLPSAAAGNGLLNNLIGYWPGNEVNGNALDLHTNALHLTDINTVTSNPGLVYALARQHTLVLQEYHTRAGDDALLSTGNVDFTLAIWLYLDSKPGATMWATGKWNAAVGQREYGLSWTTGTDRFQFFCRNIADAANVIVTANTFGAPGLATWYLVIGSYDSVADLMGISVNGGAVDTNNLVGGVADGTSPFRIGAQGSGVNSANWWNGRLGPTAFWKSAAGGGGVLTAAQRTALYNAGVGLTYAAFTL